MGGGGGSPASGSSSRRGGPVGRTRWRRWPAPARTPPRLGGAARCTSAACRTGCPRRGCARSPAGDPPGSVLGCPAWRSDPPSPVRPGPAGRAGSAASGMPPASTAIERLRPCLRRSTGLGPGGLAAAGCLGDAPLHQYQRVVRWSVHGTPARLCPRLHHRPTAPAPGRRPEARRLLADIHRDRQRRPPRPARARPGPGPAAPGDTLVVWKLTASADRCGIWSTPSAAWLTVGRVPQPPGGDRHHHPGGKLVHVFAALAEFEPDLIRERTGAGLAAARARGRHDGRPRS